jgi:acyl carrier protein
VTFEDVRAILVAALDNAGNALHNPRLSSRLADASQDVPFGEFDLDSLAAIEVCMEVEEKTGIEIDLGDLAQHGSLNALARAVAERAGR